MKRVLAFISIFLLFAISPKVFAQTYTTTQSGNWNTSSTWVGNSKPPSTLPEGDSIVVKHSITLDVDQYILGTMTVETGAVITTSSSKDIKVGKGDVDTGILYNHGTITIDVLESKPENGCVSSGGQPWVVNYGELNLSKLHVGNNCGRGSFYNMSGGTVVISGELHLDNYMYNNDSIEVQTKFKLHGGYLHGCGFIETPLLDIDVNGSRASTFGCSDVCKNGGTDPTIDVDGVIYSDLNDAYNNAPSSEIVFDPDSALICGKDYAGNTVALPIRLLSFSAYLEAGTVWLDWSTASEENNMGFTIERSTNGVDYEGIQWVEGAGNSVSTLSYRYEDKFPPKGDIYYRLQQLDENGSKTYSKTQYVNNSFGSRELYVYPNPGEGFGSSVYFGRANSHLTLKVVDLNGKLVFETKVSGHRQELPELPKGLYLIQLMTDGGNANHIRYVQI